MEYRSLIDSRKRQIRKVTKGYDSTLKLKGKGYLTNILDRLDEDTSYSLELSKKDVSRILSIATMTANRTNNKRLQNFLNDTNTTLEIWGTVENYISLNKTLFVVNQDDIKAFENLGLKETEKLTGLHSLVESASNNDFKEFNIVYNNMLYHAVFEDADVQLAVMFGDDYIPEACYTYTVNISTHETGELKYTEKDLAVVCSNTKCAYYKATLGKAYEDGSKRVSCTAIDCDKCNAFTDVLRPNELFTVCKATAYAYVNKQSNKAKTEVVNAPDYQPLPLPESDKDVVIYIKDLTENNDETVKVKIYDENYVPGTHASPREHMRSECIVHYKSGKIGKRKACIVNKGKTKTTYIVKASNGLTKKTEDKTEDSVNVNEEYLRRLLNE